MLSAAPQRPLLVLVVLVVLQVVVAAELPRLLSHRHHLHPIVHQPIESVCAMPNTNQGNNHFRGTQHSMRACLDHGVALTWSIECAG